MQNNSVIRILHITSIKELRGGDVQMYQLATSFTPNDGVESFILTRKNSVLFKKSKQEKIIETFEAPRAWNFDVRFSLKIVQLVKKLNINILHVHDSTALHLTIVAKYFLSKHVKLIYSRKLNNPIKKKWLNEWKYNHKFIERIICVSKEVKRVLQKSVKDPDKLHVIYDGIPQIMDNETSLWELPPLKERVKKKVIANFASLTEQKNPKLFVDIAEKVLEIRDDVIFLYFGDGALRDEVNDYIELKGLGKSVVLMGFIPNASGFLREVDILLMTSKFEGLPLTIYEAFQKKVPVVTSPAGGIPEAVISGKTGFICDFDDRSCFVEKIVHLLNDQHLRETITKNAFESFTSNFTIDVMRRNYLKFYRNLPS